jgi:hypothetical protein
MAVTLAQVKADQLQARKDRDTIKAKLLTTLLGETKTLADKTAEKEPRDANGSVIKRDPTDGEVEATIRNIWPSRKFIRQPSKQILQKLVLKKQFCWLTSPSN